MPGKGFGGMVDFHTHILPGIDDGSRDTETTRQMLAEERRQGVDLIVATPHFYANRMSVEGFLENRSRAEEKTRRILREMGADSPELICGAEVYFFPGIGRADAVKKLCIGESGTLLLEMPFGQWGEQELEDVQGLLRQGMRIVLAHVERYYDFQKDIGIWDQVMDLDLMKQINAGSFLSPGKVQTLLGRGRKRSFCLRFLQEHKETMIGSDCHNLTSRRPNIAEGRKAIADALGNDTLGRIDRAAEAALAREKR